MDFNITLRQKDKGWQYIISYKLDGKWKQKSKQGFKSKQDAKRSSQNAANELKENIDKVNLLDISMQGITFGEFREVFLKRQSLYSTQSTVDNFEYTLNAFKELNNKKMVDIKNIDIQNVIDKLVSKGFKYSTVKTRIAYINSFFNYAVEKFEIINENPIKKLQIKEDKEDSSRRALNAEEEKALIKALENTRYYLIALIILKCGLRIGEVLGLSYDDIDFDNRKIRIRKQFKKLPDGVYGIGELKAKRSNRIIPIPQLLADELKERMNENCNAKTDLIFDFGNKRTFQTVMNKRIKSLGFNICLHELRHTYATKLIKKGLDFKTVAYLMGHDVKETIKTYSHVTSDMLEIATTLINDDF